MDMVEYGYDSEEDKVRRLREAARSSRVRIGGQPSDLGRHIHSLFTSATHRAIAEAHAEDVPTYGWQDGKVVENSRKR